MAVLGPPQDRPRNHPLLVRSPEGQRTSQAHF